MTKPVIMLTTLDRLPDILEELGPELEQHEILIKVVTPERFEDITKLEK